MIVEYFVIQGSAPSLSGTAFAQCTLKKAKVAYNNVFRMLFRYGRRSSASLMFATHNVPCFDALLRKSIINFHSRLCSPNHVLFNRILEHWRNVLYLH